MDTIIIKKPWVVYILQCADGTFYTGITNDLENRLVAHENGTGAKYTRGRAPLKIIYTENCADRSEASKRERLIKMMDKSQKAALAS